MRNKEVINAEMSKLEIQIDKLRSQHSALIRERKAIELSEARESLRFPVGTILTRYDKWKKRWLRVIYRGVRQGRWGLENYATNIRKDGKEGADIQIHWHDRWGVEQVIL